MHDFLSQSSRLNLLDACILGGTLVSKGMISVGDLTSLLLYTVYVGSGLQTLTCVFIFHSSMISTFLNFSLETSGASS